MNQQINRPGSLESWLKLSLALAGLVLLLTLTVNSLRIAGNEWAYSNTDQRQQSFEYYFDGGTRLFGGDFISNYYLNAFLPSGYSWLYDAAGRVGDPFFFSKIVSLGLMLSFIYIGFLIAKAYAGPTWGMVSVILVFCTSLFFDRMAGGLPHSFAFPLGLFFFLGFVRRRPLWCACSLILMALFYPPVLVPYTIVFSLWLLFPRLLGTEAGPLPWLRREATALSRLFWLAGLCVLITLILVPTLYKSVQYGERISLSDVGAFPEAGPDGRYGADNRIDGKNIIKDLAQSLPSISEQIIDGTGMANLPKPAQISAILLLLCLSLYGLYSKKSLARREVRYLIALSFASVAGYAASVLVYPYAFLPHRSITFTLPIVAQFVVLFGLVELAGKFRPADNAQPDPHSKAAFKRPGFKLGAGSYIPYIMAIVILLLFVGTPVGDAKENYPGLYEYVRYEMPKDAVFAGWPGAAIEGVPLFCKKRILVGTKTDQAFHKGYVLEMRKRKKALIDAYLSDDPSALRRLRDEFGVTYLLVNLSHFEGRKVETPKTFAPLKGYASRLTSSIAPDKRAVWRLLPSLEVKRIDGYSILDLRKLS